MSLAQASPKREKAKLPILEQVSAGGVALKREADGIKIAIVSVGSPERWQLPKGIVDPGETPEFTAVREVREEAGIEATIVAPLDTVEYWYVGNRGKQRVRFHKFVYFYLMVYNGGQVENHDREVNEARWVSLEEAQTMLAFKGERETVAQAEEYLYQSARDNTASE
jgi:8-oxo-dGTP diphosphatase